MKILMLTPHSYYVDRGTPIDVDIMLRALSNRGEEVHLLCYPDGEHRDYVGVTIHRIPDKPLFRGIKPGISFTKLWADGAMFFEAVRLLRAETFDVVHADEEMCFVAWWFSKTRNLPYVYDMDSSIAQQLVEKEPKLKPMSRVFNWMEGLAVRGALACAPVCHALAELAYKHGARHLETIHDISQLADPDAKPTGFLHEKFGVERPVLMYVGNLEVYQGLDLLLEAFAVALKRGAEMDLVVAGGTDEDIAAYRVKAGDMGLDGRCHFIGRWPANRLHELLVEAEVLTAPRIKGINTPQKIFPYLHTGKAVLVTDLYTHNQLLTPEVAALAPAEPSGFADWIVKLAGDAELRTRLGRAGRAFVEAQHVFEAHQCRVDRLYDFVGDRLGLVRTACAPAERPPETETKLRTSSDAMT